MNLQTRKPRQKKFRNIFLVSWFPSFLLLLCFLYSLGGCKREERGYRVAPPAADKIQTTSVSELHPAGGEKPGPVKNHYAENAYATSEGQRLFSAFNCVGCHAHGGGGMGPALMDDKWIYGSDPQNIYATIVEGRPNGMPAFRGKIPQPQVWQLAAYVRSLGGLVPKAAAPSRSDHMQVAPQESNAAPGHPHPAERESPP
jgi:cytochrome c oxidase cbb3-type subunit III